MPGAHRRLLAVEVAACPRRRARRRSPPRASGSGRASPPSRAAPSTCWSPVATEPAATPRLRRVRATRGRSIVTGSTSARLTIAARPRAGGGELRGAELDLAGELEHRARLGRDRLDEAGADHREPEAREARAEVAVARAEREHVERLGAVHRVARRRRRGRRWQSPSPISAVAPSCQQDARSRRARRRSPRRRRGRGRASPGAGRHLDAPHADRHASRRPRRAASSGRLMWPPPRSTAAPRRGGRCPSRGRHSTRARARGRRAARGASAAASRSPCSARPTASSGARGLQQQLVELGLRRRTGR